MRAKRGQLLIKNSVCEGWTNGAHLHHLQHPSLDTVNLQPQVLPAYLHVTRSPARQQGLANALIFRPVSGAAVRVWSIVNRRGDLRSAYVPRFEA